MAGIKHKKTGKFKSVDIEPNHGQYKFWINSIPSLMIGRCRPLSFDSRSSIWQHSVLVAQPLL